MAWNIFKKKDDKSASTPSVPAKAPLQQEGRSPAVSKPRKSDAKTDEAAPALRRKGVMFSVSADTLFIRPIATEKSLNKSRLGVYAFEVKKDATKIVIKKAFFNLYGVMPTGVRVMNRQGKIMRFGRREGQRKDWKKALITVPKGTTIDIG